MSGYVVLDIEMCKVAKENRAKYGHGMETIQIGAVLLDESYNRVSTFMTYVKPQFGAIEGEIRKLTGIGWEDVKDAPCAAEAIEQFLGWIPKGDVKMVSWSMTDRFQLIHEKEAYGIENERLEELLENWIDCQALFDERLELDHPCGLSNALAMTDINADEREHDGLADAVNTAELFAKLNTEEKLKLNKYYETARTGGSSLTYSLGDLIAKLNVKWASA